MEADIALFEKIKKGDIASFEVIFEKYYIELCRYCNGFIKDPETAKEIVSDVFANIWLKKLEIDLHSNLRSYLFRSVKNLSLTKLRYNKIEVESLDADMINTARTESSADRVVHTRDFTERLEEIIDNMPEKRQLVFRLSRLEGLSYNEIAIVMSISPRTVQNHMVEAIKHMTNHKKELLKMIISIGFLIAHFIY